MLSTFLNYQLYTRDMTRTLDRIASNPVAKREADYYRENIGKGTSVDEFMDDYRLYSYAMKAYGLGDQIDSRGLVKKVLESDLNDPKSLANKLADERYRDFAKAFTFSVKASEPVVQTTPQTDALVEAYSEHRVRQAAALSSKAATVIKTAGDIRNIDDFLANETVYSMALELGGIDPEYASKDFVRQALTMDEAGKTELIKKGETWIFILDHLFTFETDGTASGGQLLDEKKANNFVAAYFESKGLEKSPTAASYDVKYYEMFMKEATNVDELLWDRRALNVALTSVGLEAGIQSESFVRSILTSDPEDPDGPLASMAEETDAEKAIKESYRELAKRYNFDADGNVPAGEKAQTETQVSATTAGFLSRVGSDSASDEKLETNLFKLRLNGIERANDLIRVQTTVSENGNVSMNDRLFNYVMNAFDLDPAKESRTKIYRVLTSDPTDPKSFVRQLKDERYVKLAAAFNFDEKGEITTQRMAQTKASQAETIELYSKAMLGEEPSEAERKKVSKAGADYTIQLASILSIEDLEKNKTVLNYALAAYGLEGKTFKKGELAQILTSDLTDPESYVNKLDDKKLAKFAGAFAFESDGSIARDAGGIQTTNDFLDTQDNYIRQLLEEEAGAENEGVRLALYFERRSEEGFKSFYDFLAEPALLKVVQTTLGLPAETGQADVEIQKRTLEKRMNLDDLQDPKQIQKFIQRFLVMYDLENGGGASSPAATLLSGDGGGGLLGML